MGLNLLKYYIARSQIREYLEYIVASGTTDISEQPDSVNANDPIPIRLGSVINSVKVFHVARHLDGEFWLTQLGITLSSDDSKPLLPEDTSIIGIFYMSKNGRDYTGSPDVLAGEEFQGDIGSVAWISVEDWESSALGKSNSGSNHRLFVFWKSEPIPKQIETI